MMVHGRLIYLHGLDSSSGTYKAVLIRRVFPDMLVPDFSGSLEDRMQQLHPILGAGENWTIVGSSFGGLMGALFATRHASQVRKLILLAPALMLPEFARELPAPIDTPTIIIHGRRDDVVPVDAVRPLAQAVFRKLTYQLVDDDHRLHRAADTIDWRRLLE